MTTPGRQDKLSEGKSHMKANVARIGKCQLRWIAAVFLLAQISSARAGDVHALMDQHKCYICHADDEDKAGPSFRDIAAMYRTTGKSRGAMASVIKAGQHGGGPWHMPPHPEISVADANAMASYILSLR